MIAGKYLKEIFQCSNCNNIIIFANNNRFDFVPLDKKDSVNVLVSYLGDKWPGFMTANFHNEKGEIFWQTNQDSGFEQGLSIQDLKELYYSKFEELKGCSVLRQSFLRVNGITEHQFNTDEVSGK